MKEFNINDRVRLQCQINHGDVKIAPGLVGTVVSKSEEPIGRFDELPLRIRYTVRFVCGFELMMISSDPFEKVA